MTLIEKFDRKKGYTFDNEKREAYEDEMKEYGYVEVPTFGASHERYCCFSCRFMLLARKSPTGYWCVKYDFPDKPHGCCDGWTLINADY